MAIILLDETSILSFAVTAARLPADTLRPATATPPPLADTWPLIRTSPSATILIDPPEAMIAAPVRRPLLLTLLAN
jgi:hypothetical protein